MNATGSIYIVHCESLQLSLKRGLPRRLGSSVLNEVAMTDEEIMWLWNRARPSADGVDMTKLW